MDPETGRCIGSRRGRRQAQVKARNGIKLGQRPYYQHARVRLDGLRYQQRRLGVQEKVAKGFVNEEPHLLPWHWPVGGQ